MSAAITGTGAGAVGPARLEPENIGGSGGGEGFGAALKSALDQVEQLHTDAQQQVGGLLQGDRQDLHNVMIAVEKADVAFQLMMQVRNKIVSAYQEVSRLQF